MGQTDEGHIRDALRSLHSSLLDLLEINKGFFRGMNYEERKVYEESIQNDLEDVKKHIDAIRVRGDSKRKAQADGTPE